jgi:RNA polymerase sigma-70 factor (ECF subfamily)
MNDLARYAPALYRKAERVLQNRDDARDVVHALYQDLFERKTTHVDLPYLYRAVTHRCLSVLRDSKNQARLRQLHTPSLLPAARGTAERIESLDALHKLVDHLDDDAAEIFVLHFVDDLPQEEIAEVVGLSRKTVGRKLEQVRVALSGLVGGTP